MQGSFVLDLAACDTPFTGDASIFVVIQDTQKRHGPIPCIDIPESECPRATRSVRTEDVDLGVRAMMRVENVLMTTHGSIQSGEVFAALEHADMTHVDQYFPVREAIAGGLRVLPITSIEIARFEPPNCLDVFETLNAALQIRWWHRGRAHAPTMR